jgi:hypothetical protein
MHYPFTDIESEIAQYMLRFAKFEFFLLSSDPTLGTLDENYKPKRISLDWQKVAQRVEQRCPFQTFKPHTFDFAVFFNESPQYLTLDENDELKWDSNDPSFDSWLVVLTRSLLQFRNNIAHGNKGCIPAPFTADRTIEFMKAGHALMNFLSDVLFDIVDWDSDIYFQ